MSLHSTGKTSGPGNCYFLPFISLGIQMWSPTYLSIFIPFVLVTVAFGTVFTEASAA